VGSLLFDWDDANLQHIALHGVSAQEAEDAVASNPWDIGSEIVHAEERVAQLGETRAGRILLVVTTWRGDALRVVTAYEPAKRLKAAYWTQKAKEHGQKA
jgi:uncharacterized DUF497 family protein